MAEKVTFVMGQPSGKKHSTQFKLLDVESSDGVDLNEATTPGGWRPVFYIPKPFGTNARKLRVTLETIE